MRKRQVKKFAKNAKRNMTPYREARKGSSKRLRRRLKAINRVHRAHDRELARRLAGMKDLLEQIDSYEPRNEKERLGLAERRAKVAGVIERREEQLRKERERKEEMESLQLMLKKIEAELMAAVSAGGGWNMVKGI